MFGFESCAVDGSVDYKLQLIHFLPHIWICVFSGVVLSNMEYLLRRTSLLFTGLLKWIYLAF